MIVASAYGRLSQDPRRIETKTGKAMAVCTMAVDIAENGAPLWLDLAAFGATADDLLRLAKGAPLSAMGRIKRRVWTDQSGQEREQLQLVADMILTTRSPRPGGSGKRRPDGNGGMRATAQPRRRDDRPPLDDEIPF